jgi:hypothetical protein
MGAYEDHLRHTAQPSDPDDRETATSLTLADYEALWFADYLREYAHYEAEDDDSGIAAAYAAYIDTAVRERGSRHVTLYVHTRAAADTLLATASYTRHTYGGDSTFPMMVYHSVEDEIVSVLQEHMADELPEDARADLVADETDAETNEYGDN